MSTSQKRTATGIGASQRLAWIDFETNGLYGMGCEVVPLEVGLVITEADLTPVTEYTALISTDQEVIDNLDDFAVRMHTDNGLLDDLAGGTGRDISEVDAELASLIGERFPAKSERTTIAEEAGYDYRGAVLAGSSVGSFDLRVLAEHFPQTRKLVAHRTYYISAVNEFAVRLGVEAVNTAASAEASSHRALSDIYDSIAKARALMAALGR